jgi:GntR family transcriptional regulator
MAEAATRERPVVPLYQGIVRALLDEVDRGVYEVGGRLPTEHELCERFGVSRHTVREALRRLQEMGYIARRQGSGSILAARRSDGLFHNSISSVDELRQYASTTRLQILSIDRIVVEEDLARRLGCRPETQWFRVSALRRAEGSEEPMAYAEIFVDVAFGDVVRNIGLVQTAVYSMIEKAYGIRIAEVAQEIEAVAADVNIASRLAIPPSSPVLIVNRRYFAEDGRLVEIAVNTHPGARFRYEMSLQRR